MHRQVDFGVKEGSRILLTLRSQILYRHWGNCKIHFSRATGENKISALLAFFLKAGAWGLVLMSLKVKFEQERETWGLLPAALSGSGVWLSYTLRSLNDEWWTWRPFAARFGSSVPILLSSSHSLCCANNIVLHAAGSSFYFTLFLFFTPFCLCLSLLSLFTLFDFCVCWLVDSQLLHLLLLFTFILW